MQEVTTTEIFQTTDRGAWEERRASFPPLSPTPHQVDIERKQFAKKLTILRHILLLLLQANILKIKTVVKFNHTKRGDSNDKSIIRTNDLRRNQEFVY